MKLSLFAGAAFATSLGCASAFSLSEDRTPSFLQRFSHSTPGPAQGVVGHYGDTACPCIGFDGLEGTVDVEVGSALVAYPREVGARCETWDKQRHPECASGGGPEWCGKQWCFVDPCNCNIDIIPEQNKHMPTARYRGHPVAYSYATCHNQLHQEHPKYGGPTCRCVGFENAPGTLKVGLGDGSTVKYPASLGSTCKAWDHGIHPDCKGDNVPDWCKAKWCYVDACSCQLPDGHVPKISSYLPEATFTGHAFYYSYETCDDEDTWTKDHHPTACVNQATPDMCSKNPRCLWHEPLDRCLGKELVHHPLCKDFQEDAMGQSAALHGARPVAMVVALLAGLLSVVAATFV